MARQHSEIRRDGFAFLDDYGAIGDGRSVALSAADGSIDWWCVPSLDAPPFFGRLVDLDGGGYYEISPVGPYSVERVYLQDSNVLSTTFTTGSGRVCLTESLNSGVAGRLPWSELARRVEGVSGSVAMRLRLSVGTRFTSARPWVDTTGSGEVIHLDGITAMLRHHDEIECTVTDDRDIEATFEVEEGSRYVFGLLATENEPMIVADLDDIDSRIDLSSKEWRDWTATLDIGDRHGDLVRRSALALKLLLYSPSGAIAAAATTSLPEGPNGHGAYDYRFAWVRDAAYTIKAFIGTGADKEVQGALAWLLGVIHRHGPELHVFYRLDGELCGNDDAVDVSGHRNSGVVRVGNSAHSQKQSSSYGDLFETAALFVDRGNLLDVRTARLLADLADRCADEWQQKDSSIWELPDEQHYTTSKIGCWVALERAARLAAGGHIEATHARRWSREADRIVQWVDDNCWSETRRAYVQFAGGDVIDASLLLAVGFGFPRRNRLESTMRHVVDELSDGGLVHRYSGTSEREGAFIACSFWLVEALAALGYIDEADDVMQSVLGRCGNEVGLLSEMIDPGTGRLSGNFPQGLSHLALINAVGVLEGARDRTGRASPSPGP